MFEDSTFESACRIHTRSRQWMIAAFAFNASILMAFIVIPLISPPMLPPLVKSFLTEVFMPPKPQPQQPQQTARPLTDVPNNPFQAPRTIPTTTYIPDAPEQPVITNSDWTSVIADPNNNPLRGNMGRPIVRQVVNAPLHISTLVEEGLLLDKRMPVYPAIAKAAGISGTVTLAAVISKTGTIENLRVISGPMMLQQAARDAVQAWRYRPYLLDGQPVEVETTVSVIFTLQR
jgi:protein TonB